MNLEYPIHFFVWIIHTNQRGSVAARFKDPDHFLLLTISLVKLWRMLAAAAVFRSSRWIRDASSQHMNWKHLPIFLSILISTLLAALQYFRSPIQVNCSLLIHHTFHKASQSSECDKRFELQPATRNKDTKDSAEAQGISRCLILRNQWPNRALSHTVGNTLPLVDLAASLVCPTYFSCRNTRTYIFQLITLLILS